jgi:hypothetical protein
MGAFDADEFPDDQFCQLGVQGGYCYLNASLIRLFAERAPGLTWRDMDLLNQRIYEQYRDIPLMDIQASFAASYCQILALLESLPEEELFAPGRYAWLGRGRLADWAAANTCNHYDWAKTQIRKSLKARA